MALPLYGGRAFPWPRTVVDRDVIKGSFPRKLARIVCLVSNPGKVVLGKPGFNEPGGLSLENPAEGLVWESLLVRRCRRRGHGRLKWGSPCLSLCSCWAVPDGPKRKTPTLG